jgi:hypothetical protein
LVVAAAAALVIFASGVAAQGESPLPTPSATLRASPTPVGQSPLDNPPASGGGNPDEYEMAPLPNELPVWATPTGTPTVTPTDTPTRTPTRTPTHTPTPALPTLTTDDVATLTTLPPCVP